MRQLWRLLLSFALIIVIISALTGCAAFEVDTSIVIDYRFTEAHTEIYTKESGQDVVYHDYKYIPDKYELLWEETYMDGHKERTWKECTRFEYQNARQELGDIKEAADGQN